jgi:hypothetical protein
MRDPELCSRGVCEDNCAASMLMLPCQHRIQRACVPRRLSSERLHTQASACTSHPNSASTIPFTTLLLQNGMRKKRHVTIAQAVLSKSTKVIQVFIGLFLEDSIGSWFGYDTKNGVYEAVGSADAKVSFTSVGDVGKVLAAIAGMSEADLGKVLDQLHVSGTSASLSEVAKLMMNAQSIPKSTISVTTVDESEYKRKTLESGAQNPAPYLRFLMGNGSIDHRSKAEGGIGNDNELVNPGERRWKWKSMEDYAAETKGRPWMD